MRHREHVIARQKAARQTGMVRQHAAINDCHNHFMWARLGACSVNGCRRCRCCAVHRPQMPWQVLRLDCQRSQGQAESWYVLTGETNIWEHEKLTLSNNIQQNCFCWTNVSFINLNLQFHQYGCFRKPLFPFVTCERSRWMNKISDLSIF